MDEKQAHRMLSSVLCAAFLTAATYSTNAQPINNPVVDQVLRAQAGTWWVRLLPQFAEGKLYFCGIEFSHLMQDWIYSQGRFITVGGAFGVSNAGNKLGVTLKVIVHDINASNMNLTPSPPIDAYFVVGTKTSAASKVASTVSDTPGGLFVIFQPSALNMLVDSLVAEKVTVAFSRRKGGADVLAPIDTTVEATDENGGRKRTDKIALQFADCVKQLSR